MEECSIFNLRLVNKDIEVVNWVQQICEVFVPCPNRLMGLSKHHSLVYEHDFRLGSVVRVRSGIKSVDLLYLQHDLRFHVTLSKQNGMQV